MTGEMAIRVTIWLAMGLYALSALCRSRAAYTAGFVAYVAHVIAVFHFAHGWSHATAFDYTVRRTEEVTGFAFGGGLFVNYAFTLLWMADVAWWWVDRRNYERRPWWVNAAIHGIFLFMIFNATVVFGVGAVRWYGGAICSVLLMKLLHRLRGNKSAART